MKTQEDKNVVEAVRCFDFVVIGGGSAGYHGARTAADLRQKVALIEAAEELGGLCILRGCMPSKTLLYAAEVLHLARMGDAFGLEIPTARADMQAVQERKRRIISDFADYRIRGMESDKFELIRSRAKFVDPHTVELTDGSRITGRRFLISTGSKPSVPSVPGLRETPFWTSDDVLELDFVPKSVVILGGGVVACELSQFLCRIGSKVTLIQRSEHLLSGYSDEAAMVLEEALRAEGVRIFTGTSIKQVSGGEDGVLIEFQRGEDDHECRADFLLNALGRQANTTDLGLDRAGVDTLPNGSIIANGWQQTSVPHVYAAGDCCGDHKVVHLAVRQGEIAAKHAVEGGDANAPDEMVMLGVMFTDPQVAMIGESESQLKKDGRDFLTADYPFGDHGKSILMEAHRGHVKVLAEPGSGRILGAEIIGKDAGELIHIFSGPMAMGATVFDLLRAPWYHPTLAEILTYPLEELAGKVRADVTK